MFYYLIYFTDRAKSALVRAIYKKDRPDKENYYSVSILNGFSKNQKPMTDL